MMKRVYLPVLAVLVAPRLFAAEPGGGFLEFGGGARSAALMGAYTAAAGDLDSLIFNPAGLSSLAGSELAVTHTRLPLDNAYQVLQFGSPLRNGGWGLHVARFGSARIEARDGSGRITGEFRVENRVGGLSFSRSFSHIASVGVTAKFVESRIQNDAASTAAFDAGILARAPYRSLWFGAAVRNVGGRLRHAQESDSLPSTLSLGAATEIMRMLRISVDVVQSIDGGSRRELLAGIDYAVGDNLAVRGGYSSAALFGGSGASGPPAFQGGLGIRVREARLDIAIEPVSDFGTTERVTLSYAF